MEEDQSDLLRVYRDLYWDRYQRGLKLCDESLEHQRVPPLFELPNHTGQSAFQCALMDWRLADWVAFKGNLNACVDLFEEMLRRRTQFRHLLPADAPRMGINGYLPEALFAAFLLGRQIDGLDPEEKTLESSPEDAFWFRDGLARSIYFGGLTFSAERFEEVSSHLANRGLAKIYLEGFRFYFDLLSGDMGALDKESLFAAHSKMYAKRAKSRTSGSQFLFGGGETLNAIVPDYYFAVIARHLGIEGDYPHLLPAEAFG